MVAVLHRELVGAGGFKCRVAEGDLLTLVEGRDFGRLIELDGPHGEEPTRVTEAHRVGLPTLPHRAGENRRIRKLDLAHGAFCFLVDKANRAPIGALDRRNGIRNSRQISARHEVLRIALLQPGRLVLLRRLVAALRRFVGGAAGCGSRLGASSISRVLLKHRLVADRLTGRGAGRQGTCHKRGGEDRKKLLHTEHRSTNRSHARALPSFPRSQGQDQTVA